MKYDFYQVFLQNRAGVTVLILGGEPIKVGFGSWGEPNKC